MRVLYIIPNQTVKTGGNWVTVSRLKEGFEKRGVRIDIVETSQLTEKMLSAYNIVHAFHVFKSLKKVSHILEAFHKNKAVIVSFTGTDLKEIDERIKRGSNIVEALNKTDGIVVFHKESYENLIEKGIFSNKISVIGQVPKIFSFEKLKKSYTLSPLPKDYVSFLFAAGIREVKAPIKMLEMMSELAEENTKVRLMAIGPVLDEDLGKKFTEMIRARSWASYMGEVSHEEAQALIVETDIILNTSIAEGMSNVLLEGKYLGKPILASDIPGNRSIVDHGKTGLLYKDKKDFIAYGKILSEDEKLRKEMGLSSLKASLSYSLEDEVDLYQNLYLSVRKKHFPFKS